MVELTRVYAQTMPKTRFIGKRYFESDRDTMGSFASYWDKWFEKGWFDTLEKCDALAEFEDNDAYIGLMRWKAGETFEYWIGMFLSPDAAVPEGFDSVDFDESLLCVGWLHGPENEVYCKEDMCAEACKEAGYRLAQDGQGACWFFERYGCPRFTTPDEQGNIILDVCHFVCAD